MEIDMTTYIIGTDTSLPTDQDRDVRIVSRCGTVTIEGPFLDWAGFATLRDGIDDGLTVDESQAAGDQLAHRIANGDTAAELASLGVDCAKWLLVCAPARQI
jgi:hypothetical protein